MTKPLSTFNRVYRRHMHIINSIGDPDRRLMLTLSAGELAIAHAEDMREPATTVVVDALSDVLEQLKGKFILTAEEVTYHCNQCDWTGPSMDAVSEHLHTSGHLP